jgi:hypothetical protein
VGPLTVDVTDGVRVKVGVLVLLGVRLDVGVLVLVAMAKGVFVLLGVKLEIGVGVLVGAEPLPPPITRKSTITHFVDPAWLRIRIE